MRDYVSSNEEFNFQNTRRRLLNISIHALTTYSFLDAALLFYTPTTLCSGNITHLLFSRAVHPDHSFSGTLFNTMSSRTRTPTSLWSLSIVFCPEERDEASR